jgi:ankyrin repeat protein
MELFKLFFSLNEDEIVKYINNIKDKKELNSVNIFGWSPLMFAIKLNLEKVYNLLIDLGCDLNIMEYETYNSALYMACKENMTELAHKLIDKGADINLTGMNNESPLMIACENENIPLINKILSLNPDLSEKTSFDITVLHYAIYAKLEDIAIELVNRGADIDARTEYHTPLMMACRRNLKKLSELLINKGCNLDYQELAEDYNALMICTWEDDMQDIGIKIIEAGADLLAQDCHGYDVYQYIQNDRRETFRPFINKLYEHGYRSKYSCVNEELIQFLQNKSCQVTS